jgi:hypothetical protein
MSRYGDCVNNKIFSHNLVRADKDCSSTNTTRGDGELITVSKSFYDVERRSDLESRARARARVCVCVGVGGLCVGGRARGVHFLLAII